MNEARACCTADAADVVFLEGLDCWKDEQVCCSKGFMLRVPPRS